MGILINPGDSGFVTIRASKYVDKSGLIVQMNKTLGTTEKLTCVSRPRRFGKSFAAKMLCAYYDATSDSHALFDDLAIARDPSYERHLNAYNVLYLDMSQILQEASGRRLVDYLTATLQKELRRELPSTEPSFSLSAALVNAVQASGRPFIAILDEWDAPVRESPADAHDYLELLRALFKSSATTDKVFAGAFLTGILPIKKDKGQSAVSDFWEYSVLFPGPFAPYVGFLEDEVCTLCDQVGLDFHQMQHWYDGYELDYVKSVYNPYAVMRAVKSRRFGSYWRQTSAADTLLTYLELDFEGLQDDVVRLMAGEELEVETGDFKNDPALIGSRDDALTLMIHLGYLTYEDEFSGHGWARIPNAELHMEFEKVLRQATHPELVRLVRESDELLSRTIALDAEYVAEAVAKVHDSNYAPKFYNDEQALRHTVKMAYISAIDQYARVEELPSGHGLADLVFIPRKRSALPALVVELKWNESAAGAIAQVKDRNYAGLPRELSDESLLVGISYDKKTKVHTCCIEKV